MKVELKESNVASIRNLFTEDEITYLHSHLLNSWVNPKDWAVCKVIIKKLEYVLAEIKDDKLGKE